MTTLETQVTVDGTATNFAYTTTTVKSATQSGSALGASPKGSGRKPHIAAIVGGVIGGAVGLLLFIALGAWCARNRRWNRASVHTTAQGPGEIAEPLSGPESPVMAERSPISPQATYGESVRLLSGARFRLFLVHY